MRQSTKRKRERISVVERRFPSESALCDEFTGLARAQGYRVFPECSGWDLLLMDPTSGLQVGVQAKLKATPEVLLQALQPSDFSARGPDVHAVLVTDHLHNYAWQMIARELRLLVIAGTEWAFTDFPVRELIEDAPRWHHRDPAWVPDFEVPGMSGGASGPRQLTPWKIAAVKLCAKLRARGYLTRADFDRANVSLQRWVYAPQPWLRGERHGKQYRYVATGHPLPDELYPEVAAALAAAGVAEVAAV